MSDRHSMKHSTRGTRPSDIEGESSDDDAGWSRFMEGWQIHGARRLFRKAGEKSVYSLDTESGALPPNLRRMMITPRRSKENREELPRDIKDYVSKFKEVCEIHTKQNLREFLTESLSKSVQDALRNWDNLAETVIDQGSQWLSTRPFSDHESLVRDFNAISGAVYYFMHMQNQRLSAHFAKVVRQHEERYTEMSQDFLGQVANVTKEYVETPSLIPGVAAEQQRDYGNLFRFLDIEPELREHFSYTGPLQ